MSRIFTVLLLIPLVISVASAQNSTTPPATNQTNDSSSKQSQPAADNSAPAQTAPAANSDQKKSAVKRKLEDLEPHCINIFAYKTCWNGPAPSEPKPAAKETDPEYAKDMDVGDFYLRERRNYSGAMLRFRDALAHKPDDPPATFKLAQSLEGLRQVDEARDQYQTYLKLDPKGQYAAEASKALERLQGKSAVGKSKQQP
jgi:tetratricopeptide (TPR) repeat protein